MHRKGKNIRILYIGALSLVLFVVLLHIAHSFFSSPPHYYRLAILNYISSAYQEKDKLPSDLLDLEINVFKTKLRACPITTKPPFGSLLVVYDPNFRDDMRDWIAIVRSRALGNQRDIISVLWNDGTKTGERDDIQTLTKDKSGLKYYYISK